MDENCESMLLNCTEWCVVWSMQQGHKRSERYWAQWGWISVKSCTLFCIPTEALRLTEQTAGPIETNGTSILECYSTRRSCWCLLGHCSFLWGYVCVYLTMYVCVCVFDILDRGFWTRTNCSFSFTYYWIALLFTGMRVHQVPLPTLLGMMHSFVLYPVPKKH